MTAFPANRTNLVRLLSPLVLILGVFLGKDALVSLAGDNFTIVGNLPYILFAIAILICQTFNQGRMGMIALLMTVCYWVIQTRLQTPLATGTTRLEYTLLAFILPVAAMMVYLFPEKRLFSQSGALYSLLLLFMVGWAAITVRHYTDIGQQELWDGILLIVPQVSTLPLVIVCYSVLLILTSAMLLAYYSRALDFTIYLSLLCAFCTFFALNTPYISSLLFSLAGLLTIANVISTSHELAFVDQLTEIPGRRALESEMKHLGRTYTIAMLDIDHFKSFNDTYGHDTGDQVLRLVASKMTQTRGQAKVYRYGGEEFTVLFKGKTKQQAKPILEDLRQSIQDYRISLRDKSGRPQDDTVGTSKRNQTKKVKTVQVTISIGVADSKEERDPTAVTKAADKALYRAKDKGRNRVSF
ncbi:diguanylate cyclase (plasmid) [Vibrio sp. qd031]|uniref:GGDEF domain-containing protein n=1 Tax=Vibrio sp. qd031 TaxID=1603038 RepID=UPI000A0FB48E|nr:GGDEF domain-containing protein [Vibrio sp. qd031]ORT52542.1 diguanylate cyclase [Vibrio sp. qd031]